ncbi:MAG: urea transporter, partial [Nitrosotalea sp.]
MTVYSTGNPLLDIFYILFNGISEIPLFSSPVTGILILAGVFLASRKAGAMMIMAGLAGAAVAIILGADYNLVAFGLFGYNSILTGMAFWSGPFSKTNKATFWFSIFGAGVTAVFWMAQAHVMGDLFVLGGKGTAIPGFTSSFVFTTWFLMLAAQRFGRDVCLKKSGDTYKMFRIGQSENSVRLEPTEEVTPSFKWTTIEFMKATLKGVSQITFIENWKTGIFWVVGLSLSFELAPILTGNPINWWSNGYSGSLNPYYLAGLMALWGSGIGLSVSILMKIPVVESRSGLHGFNQVLVMIAITSVLPLSWI